MCELGECLHHGLEEGGVVGPCGGVGLGILDLSSSSSSLDLGSCSGYGLGEVALCLLEDCARVADEYGHEFHLSPHHLEGGDEWGLLCGPLLKPLVASEVLAKSDFDEDEVALLTVKSFRVRRRGVRYSSGVNEVGGVPCPARKRVSWVSRGSIKSGMRVGASVHSRSPLVVA